MNYKWIALVAGIGLALILVGAGFLGMLPDSGTPSTVVPTASPTPVRASVVAREATPTVVAATPSSTSTPLAQPSSTAAPAVSAAEAQQVVRAYFAALDASDYARARDLTAGAAREKTDQLISRVESEEKARGVDLVIQTKRLDLAPPVPSGHQMNMDADFTVDINGKVGPIIVPGQTVSGKATFTVDRVDGQVKIVEMTGMAF